MKLSHVVAAVSLSVSGLALSAGAKSELNCEVKGKKVHVKDEAACTKKNGVWLPAAAAPAADKAAAPDADKAAAPAAEGAAVDASAPAAEKVEAEPKK